MAGFSFDTSGFQSGKELNRKIERAAKGVLAYHRPHAEEHMKHNAPWNDRTTNARNGLGARVRGGGKRVALVLFHSVDYGIYLELGTEDMSDYPIIIPTIDLFVPKVRTTLIGLLDRLDRWSGYGAANN